MQLLHQLYLTAVCCCKTNQSWVQHHVSTQDLDMMHPHDIMSGFVRAFNKQGKLMTKSSGVLCDVAASGTEIWIIWHPVPDESDDSDGMNDH